MRTTAFAVGLTLAGLSGSKADPPKDPCTVVTPADVQTLAPGVKIGTGVSANVRDMALSCTYEWGAGANKYSLAIVVGEVAKMWPGSDSSKVVEAVMLETKVSGATEIPGVGQAAIFKSEAVNTAQANAIAKPFSVNITLQGPNARGKQGQLTSLLKTAVSRL